MIGVLSGAVNTEKIWNSPPRRKVKIGVENINVIFPKVKQSDKLSMLNQKKNSAKLSKKIGECFAEFFFGGPELGLIWACSKSTLGQHQRGVQE